MRLQTWRVKFDGISTKQREAAKAEERAAREQSLETGNTLDKVNYYLMEAVDYLTEVCYRTPDRLMHLDTLYCGVHC